MSTIMSGKTVRRSTTRTGAQDNPSSSATAGRSMRTAGKTRCYFWHPMDTGALPMTVAAMAGQSQPWNGNDMDTYADDLSELVETLDLKGAS